MPNTLSVSSNRVLSLHISCSLQRNLQGSHQPRYYADGSCSRFVTRKFNRNSIRPFICRFYGKPALVGTGFKQCKQLIEVLYMFNLDSSFAFIIVIGVSVKTLP